MDPADPKSPSRSPSQPPAQNRREARLAQALRTNLRRRKQAPGPTMPAED